jgi:hypothetical protein
VSDPQRPPADDDAHTQDREHDLEQVQNPMDDPQTRPAVDPDADPPEVV